MKTPLFTSQQFLDAAGLNAAAGIASGNVAATVSGLSLPGLIHPEAISLTYSGLAVTVAAPMPFQVMFGTGQVAGASGIITNQISSSYNVSFSGVVPGSGSVTAYLVASAASISSGAYQVVGPPPGHPDYNPVFAATTAYATTIDSLNFTPTLTAPDGFSTFEIGRATISAAATGVTLSTIYQQRAQVSFARQILQVSGAVAITPGTHGGKILEFIGAGTGTLPPVALSNGLGYTFNSQTSGLVTIQSTGGESIYGGGAAGTAVTSFLVNQYSLISIVGIIGGWQVTGISQSAAGGSVLGLTYGGVVSGTFNAAANTRYQVDCTTVSGKAVQPVSPNQGEVYQFEKYGTNLFTIELSGKNYRGIASNPVTSSEGIECMTYTTSGRGYID